MPESGAAPGHPGRLTSDSARELASRRWPRDNQGLGDCIDRLDKRSDALTGEQRDRLAGIADRAIDDPAVLARAARIVRIAMARGRLTSADLAGGSDAT
jgi:hypothetical protein